MKNKHRIKIAWLTMFSLIMLAACGTDDQDPDPASNEITSTTVRDNVITEPVVDRVADNRPNILLIVVDDVGYNDLGVFGSRINTPHIDELASNGVLLTQFHTAPTCSPTRGILLSGTDNHVAGPGTWYRYLQHDYPVQIIMLQVPVPCPGCKHPTRSDNPGMKPP